MSEEPQSPVAERDVAAYASDGAVCLRGVIAESWIERLGAGLALARARPGAYAQDHTIEGEAGGFFSDLYMSQRVPAFRDFVFESPVAEIAGRLMGASRVNFLHDAMWIKEPGTSRRTPWHHDQPFYCAEGDQMCVVWIPLDPIPRTLSLECLAGSHRWGRRFRPERINGGWYDGYGEDDGFESPPTAAAAHRDHRVLGWEMAPGDCLAFDGMTLHGAPGAAAGRGRRAISVVLLGERMVYVERRRETQPSYAGCGLAPGEAMDCQAFPRLWPR